MLRVENLSVKVGEKYVLRNVNLRIPEGEVHVLFGPNGSGKSSLIMSILGFPAYQVVSGRILFKGVDITDTPTNERVKLGLGVSFQNPPAIRGVKLADVLRHISPSVDGIEERIFKIAERIKFPSDFLNRDVNLGFSGGEIKKSEILQVLVQEPDLVILDEPDSGVDVENLQIIGEAVNELLKDRTALIITHMGYILHYVDADEAHVLIDGAIACSGSPIRILGQILREGYGWCKKCPKVRGIG